MFYKNARIYCADHTFRMGGFEVTEDGRFWVKKDGKWWVAKLA